MRQFLRNRSDIMMLDYLARSNKAMTDNEIKLIEMIRNHSNPGEAFVTALEIILLFIKHEPSESA